MKTENPEVKNRKGGITDSWQRQINYLRISVTDHCNLNCVYCSVGQMLPLSHDDILRFEEVEKIVRVAAEMGISKIRLTGGEPLMRPGFTDLVKKIAEIDGIDDISLTSNGILLARYAEELKQAGLNRVNISLDTLQPERFKKITGHDRLQTVLKGIEAAHKYGLEPVKINMVVLRGVNDGEVVDFARKTIDDGWHVRYIEYMPLGSADSNGLVTSNEIKERVSRLGEMEPFAGPEGNGPARYYRFSGASGTLGFITPMTEHFCADCNRLRLTSDGQLRPCLLAEDEADLKAALRDGADPQALKEIIQQAVNQKREQHNLSGGLAPEKKGRPMCQIGG